MIKKIKIDEYICELETIPIIDVRSPKEYKKGHIINAINIPLFSDDERADVGTVYVQQSREKAIELGYKYVNPKLDFLLNESKAIAQNNTIAVHCWRGGMRSQSFAQLLSENGLTVYLIEGGYKAFRNFVIELFNKPYTLHVLGGYTGSGKTKILTLLKLQGNQVADLEYLAKHKGSAFGAYMNKPQPTSEQFENNLFWIWRNFDLMKPIWIEDESMNIGDVNIQQDLFARMRKSKVYFLNIPKTERAKFLVHDYGKIDKNKLASSIQRISKRMGGLKTKETLKCLEEDNYYQVALNCLDYYDKYYKKGLEKRDENLINIIDSDTIDFEINTNKLLSQL